MAILAMLEKSAAGWMLRQPAASETALAQLQSEAPFKLPNEYLDLLRFSNGGECDISVEPEWLALWPAEEVIKSNEPVPDIHAGLFGFGSNGAGELLAFDLRDGHSGQIVSVPWIGDLGDALVIAKHFAEFVTFVGKSRAI